MYKKIFLTFVCLFLFVSDSFSQVIIQEKDRTKNISEFRDGKHQGFCSFACLQTLGRHNKITELYDVLEKRAKESDYRHWDGTQWVDEPYVAVKNDNKIEKTERNIGTNWGIYTKLQSLGVKFYFQPDGDSDLTIIKYAIKNKMGCMVAMHKNAFFKDSECHEIIILDLNDQEVEILDPNHIKSSIKKPRSWFNHYWTGRCFAVYK